MYSNISASMVLVFVWLSRSLMEQTHAGMVSVLDGRKSAKEQDF